MLITQLLQLSLFYIYFLHEDLLLIIIGFVSLFTMYAQNGRNLTFSTHQDSSKFIM